ncbi:hypothetical protein C2R22_03895 [Salinigranum rubrum]|uniref:Uncharacterized protein n=1 Tax=Salinigranum rubrum TaxID=755307 RepID=A0A2I8VG93_9EURY|nr:hypothetical protein [Salinigranum rubrum]AUV80904.1 hypothetical protein C2R22_03895 [Salinigranum rubrum]
MQSSRSPTVYVPSADHAPEFHTTRRCRHCPPSSREVSRAEARDAGLVECETCYEDRVCGAGVPFTLVSPPREPMPSVASRVEDSVRDRRIPGDD